MIHRNADERPECRSRDRARRIRRDLREGDRVLIGLHVAHANIAGPSVTLEIGLNVGGRVLFLHIERVLVVLAREWIAIHEARAVVGRELLRSPEPDSPRNIATERREVARVVLERGRVVRRARAAAVRAENDGPCAMAPCEERWCV